MRVAREQDDGGIRPAAVPTQGDDLPVCPYEAEPPDAAVYVKDPGEL